MSAPPYVLAADGKVFPAGLNQINANFADIYNRMDEATLSAIQWLAGSFAPVYVDGSTYTLEGDQTGIHAAGRMVRAHLTGGHVIEAIISSDYSETTELTTVVLASAVLDDTMDGVELGILTPGADSALPADVVRTFGDQTITGSLSLPAPTADGHGARKLDVDALAASLRGFISGLSHRRKDADEVTVLGGVIEINGVLYFLDELTDVQLTGLVASAWNYIYVEAPEEGLILSDSEFSADDTAPNRYHAKAGAWYNTAGDKRCIGFFLTDGSANIRGFNTASGVFRFTGGNSILNTGSPATTATALSADVPDLGRLRIKVWGSVEDSGNNSAGLAVGDGDDSGISLASDSLFTVQAIGASGLYLRGGDREVLTNDLGQIYYICGTGDTSAKLTVFSIGIPNGMAG